MAPQSMACFLLVYCILLQKLDPFDRGEESSRPVDGRTNGWTDERVFQHYNTKTQEAT